MRKLELLAPAKNLECGIAAIEHGADAVYIGASRFGARAAAGNSVDDIRQLCVYAHQYDARVYVTVNTIVYDHEWQATQELLIQLKDAYVDAILVQDMSLVNNCPLPIHASTQTDNRSVEKVAWLRQLGFKRVVLARELSIEEIRNIHDQVPDVELEVFVHGALCVSYSGLCYASQHCFGRSANRGECAQFCRLKFDLVDAGGEVIERQRHLLSLKDMNQLDNLEQLADAGACSFKIEGRLKDIGYVKNVTSAYSQQLDRLVQRYPDRYCRSSRGHCSYQFQPDLNRTFNRGYTTYFSHGRQPDMSSFDTPKAIGQFIGKVKWIKSHKAFQVDTVETLVNGDGLCFVNDKRELEGFRVNRVEQTSVNGVVTTMLYPLKMPNALKPGVSLYRSQDQYFEQILSKPTAIRKLPIKMELQVVDDGYTLSIDGQAVAKIDYPHEMAKSSQKDNIVRQLTKLGDTPFTCEEVIIPDGFSFFIPSSRIAELRRLAIERYLMILQNKEKKADVATNSEKQEDSPSFCKEDTSGVPSYPRSYFYNISNTRSRLFYFNHGLTNPEEAFELHCPKNPLIMQCRYCLRYALGFCVKYGGKRPRWREPLVLRLSDGRQFPIEFDCRHCQMNVYAENKS